MKINESPKRIRRVMTDEQIKQASDVYIGFSEDKDEGVYTCMRRRAFQDGANWRINSVWHKASDKPHDNKNLCALDRYGRVFIAGPNNAGWKDTVDSFHIIRWAYVKDLIPTNNN